MEDGLSTGPNTPVRHAPSPFDRHLVHQPSGSFILAASSYLNDVPSSVISDLDFVAYDVPPWLDSVETIGAVMRAHGELQRDPQRLLVEAEGGALEPLLLGLRKTRTKSAFLITFREPEAASRASSSLDQFDVDGRHKITLWPAHLLVSNPHIARALAPLRWSLELIVGPPPSPLRTASWAGLASSLSKLALMVGCLVRHAANARASGIQRVSPVVSVAMLLACITGWLSSGSFRSPTGSRSMFSVVVTSNEAAAELRQAGKRAALLAVAGSIVLTAMLEGLTAAVEAEIDQGWPIWARCLFVLGHFVGTSVMTQTLALFSVHLDQLLAATTKLQVRLLGCRNDVEALETSINELVQFCCRMQKGATEMVAPFWSLQLFAMVGVVVVALYGVHTVSVSDSLADAGAVVLVYAVAVGVTLGPFSVYGQVATRVDQAASALQRKHLFLVQTGSSEASTSTLDRLLMLLTHQRTEIPVFVLYGQPITSVAVTRLRSILLYVTALILVQRLFAS